MQVSEKCREINKNRQNALKLGYPVMKLKRKSI